MRSIGLTLALATLNACTGSAANLRARPESHLRLDRSLTRPFQAAGVRGVIVLLDPETGSISTNDRGAATEGFLPASTFKIFNSLVALEEGAVRDEHEVLPWDGTAQPIAAWERDHDMASAIRDSVVWFYQEMARRVGPDKLQGWLDRVGYGNRNIAPAVDRFWLDGDLRISALEQVLFVDRLRRGDLPFSARSMEIVRRITIVEQAGGAVLHAKTGWGSTSDADVGWYVGWVERENRSLVFALRIEMRDQRDLALRPGIVRQVLTERGWLPRQSNAALSPTGASRP